MLKEEERLSEMSQWKKVKSWFHKDQRYKAIESSTTKEEMFNEYIKSLNRVSGREGRAEGEGEKEKKGYRENSGRGRERERFKRRRK